MPKPFSEDLRVRVVATVDSGKTIEETANIFQIATVTVKRWIARKKNTGSVLPAMGYQKGHSHKITDLEKFKALALEHRNESLEALAQKIGNVSDTTVGRAMHKIGFSKKKDLWVQRTK